ncbi:MAG: leucine-rich repeat protein [Treponema sp.]|nr:leucine-rich repeat protein [Candidatus Treponema merdequi]
MSKKTLTLIAACVFALFITGCQNLTSFNFKEESARIENANPAAEPEKEKPFITFDFGSSSARTVNPVFDITKLTDITLKGTVTDGVEETLFTKKTYAEITDSEFKVQLKKEGTYSFVMTAKLNERNYSSSLSGKEIKCGKNELSFSLAFTNQDENFVAGKGNIQINLKVKNNSNIKYAKVTLLKTDGTPAFDEEKIDNSNNGTFIYTKENVTAGNYTVKYSFYNGENLLGYYMETVNVSKDLSSTAIREVEDVAQYYKITYELGDGSWVEGYEPASVYSKFGISALPAWDKAFKVNDGVEGWYYDENCTAKATNESIKTKTGDITLYPKYAHIAYAEGFGNLVNRIKASSATETEPIKILDKNPDLGKIAGALKDESVKVGIDLSECTELKSLPDSCFLYCSSISQITLPESVTTIGAMAFDGCSSISQITLPESVTTIGSSVFENCSSLSQITLPEGVTTVGHHAFFNCNSLTKIKIPKGVTIINACIFDGCSSLSQITLPEVVTKIEDDAFFGCSSLSKITLPEGVTTIGRSAFKGCSLLSQIMLPESVTTIGEEAFFNCSSLTEIKIPFNVTSIGDDDIPLYPFSSFIGCTGLTKVTAPCRFKDKENFNKCFGDQYPKINFEWEHSFTGENSTCDCGEAKTGFEEGSCGTNAKFTFVYKTGLLTITGSGKVTKSGTLTVEGTSTPSSNVFGTFADKIKTVTIDDAITDVDTDLFSYFSNLTTVTAPCTIQKNAGIDESKLKEITWHHKYENHGKNCNCGKGGEQKSSTNQCPNSTVICTYYDKEKLAIYSGTGELTMFSMPDPGMVDEFFDKLCDTEIIEICDGVTKIGANAFDFMSRIKEVKMSDTVTSIESGAFSVYGKSYLAKITLSKNLTEIGSSAFSGCTSLENIVIPDSVETIGYGAFSGCTSLKTVTIPNGVETIEGKLFLGCTSLKNIVIPDSVKSIDYEAFSGCTSLENIVIPDNVKSIEYNAFSECTKLKTVTIPNGVETIDVELFLGCISLENIEIPDSVKFIYDNVFNDCTNLKTVKIGTGVEYISDYAFEGCPSTVQITAPEKLKGNKCFNGFNVTWY